MNISKQVIILSAERDGDTIENRDLAIRTLRNCLNDCNLSFREATGVFENGPEETSFVVVVNNEAEIQSVKEFAFLNFGQDAILFQDSNQEAYLINKDGTEKRLGRLEQVPKEVALGNGSYTLMGNDYYTTIPRT